MVPDYYWQLKSNQYDSNLPYLQDQQCISVHDVNLGHDIESQSKRGDSMLLRCTQPSALFDGKTTSNILSVPETSDLLKHYTWKKALTPNPFVAMEFIKPLAELTNITLYFYKKESLKIHIPFVRLCASTSSDSTQCNQVELSPRPWSNNGVVVWPVTLFTPVKSVTFLNISFQYELESIHQWIFLSEVRVGEREGEQVKGNNVTCE